MFGRKDNELSTISEYLGKKSKQLKKKNQLALAKVEQAFRGKHQHYFSKQDVQENNENARCKVCKMLLSEFRVQKKMENWTPHLKPVQDASQNVKEKA